jgi:hypothetical protein
MRGHITRVLEEWSLGELRYAATLIASELITNAVQQTATFTWAARPGTAVAARRPDGPRDLDLGCRRPSNAARRRH